MNPDVTAIPDAGTCNNVVITRCIEFNGPTFLTRSSFASSVRFDGNKDAVGVVISVLVSDSSSSSIALLGGVAKDGCVGKKLNERYVVDGT